MIVEVNGLKIACGWDWFKTSFGAWSFFIAGIVAVVFVMWCEWYEYHD